AESAGYTLYVEPREPGVRDPRLAALVDAGLRSSNIEYDGKRASGRLEPLQVGWLRPGTGDAFREHRVAGGQRDAQFKYLHLQRVEECGFDFEPYLHAD
ncbi:MAG: GH3 auxin-responsive promoter family protein, partial [Pseudomonadales bacterium]|nr:GH3 auxin-responsive promoter family protein [Pseudomonadales bacterium]